MTTSIILNPALDETANVSNVAYNGFRFPPARHARVSFSPEISDDGRTVKYLRADLSIEFIWLAMLSSDEHLTTYNYDRNGITDTTFPNLRKRLTTAGQPLRFWSQGIGLFSVQENGIYDVNYGPRPKIVSEVPIAGAEALRVTWECSTWITNCPGLSGYDANLGLTGIAQFPYSVSWGIGTNGITTRTISGSVEVPLSRDPLSSSASPLTTVRGTADEVREQVAAFFPMLLGFERSQNYTLSPDRKTLSFTITDQEIQSENPFFPGIVRTSVSRRYSSDYKNGFTIWSGSVSGSIEVAPGYSKIRGWLAFISVFDDIFKKRTKGKIPVNPAPAPTSSGDTTGTKDSWGMLTSISLEEEIYGRSLSFSFGYRLFCSLAELFKATGLFQPLTISPGEADWSLWRTSMSTIQGPRGWRELQFFSSDDVIVDLCSPTQVLPGRALPGPESEPTPEQKSESGDKPDGPSPDQSYIHFDSSLIASTTDGAVYSHPLQKSSPVQESTSSDVQAITATEFGTEESSGNTPLKPIIHRIRPTVYKFRHVGSAVRVSHQPNVPNLKSIGGVNAIKTGTDIIHSKVLGSGTDVQTGNKLTIFGITWDKEYILDDRPKDATMDYEGNLAQYR